MEHLPLLSGPERRLDRHLALKGLRPRDAAYLTAAFWAGAVAVFGVVERLIDRRTCQSVRLGMWWAIAAVTVGYDDVVPDQTAGNVIARFLCSVGCPSSPW